MDRGDGAGISEKNLSHCHFFRSKRSNAGAMSLNLLLCERQRKKAKKLSEKSSCCPYQEVDTRDSEVDAGEFR